MIGTFQVAQARPQVMVRGLQEMKGRLWVAMKWLWWAADRLQVAMGEKSPQRAALSNTQVPDASGNKTLELAQ